MSGNTQYAEESPFIDRALVGTIVATVSRAEAMGLLSEEAAQGFALDAETLDALFTGVTEAGLARAPIARLRAAQAAGESPDVAWLRDRFEELNTLLMDAPVPEREWLAAKRYFDTDQLAGLLGISGASVTRYMSGARPTPQTVATRLHWLMLVVGDLLGSYNAFGVRRWFERPRSALGGRSPAAVLKGIAEGWSPEHPEVKQVGALAHALTASSAT